jgi:hypothetical protein
VALSSQCASAWAHARYLRDVIRYGLYRGIGAGRIGREGSNFEVQQPPHSRQVGVRTDAKTFAGFMRFIPNVAVSRHCRMQSKCATHRLTNVSQRSVDNKATEAI